VTLRSRPFTEQEARTAASWAYEGEYAVYDGDPSDWASFLRVDDAGHGYHALVDDDDGLIGYCCFGAEARVPGQSEPDDGVLDVGGGMRPDLTGHGLGSAIFQAIVVYAADRFAPKALRTVVMSFNERSLRMCEHAGFERGETFKGSDGREYVALVR